MMKNPLIIIIIVVVLVGVGVLTLTQKSTTQPDTVTDDHKTMDKDEHDEMMSDDKSGSRYVEYSKKALDNAVDKRRVLYFYANWCPICRPADLNFKENVNKIPEDVVVIRVNYNDTDTDQEEKDLAQKYGITYQHTFVQIDAQGNKVTAWNGGQIDELLNNIK